MIKRKAIVILLIFSLSGCQSQKARHIDTVWFTTNTDGETCLFVGKGVSIKSMKKIEEQWKFEPCAIGLFEDTNVK
jgi:hypothetical protein